MGHLIEYLVVVPGREMTAHLDASPPENLLRILDTRRCVSFNREMRHAKVVSRVDISPVASLVVLNLKWTPVFVSDYEKPDEVQWQTEKRAEVHEFELLLCCLFPNVPILAVCENIEDEWAALISKAENLEMPYDLREIGLSSGGQYYPGYSYYGWLCERRYIDQFFEWVERTYPKEDSEQPERWKGWTQLQ